MNPNGLRARILRGETLAGTFVKTPTDEVIEVLALAGLDFICIDCEHAPSDRRALAALLAVARGLGLPALVRVPEFTLGNVLMTMDCGAAGIVVPHVTSGGMAAAIAKSARFGDGGSVPAGSPPQAGQGVQAPGQAQAMDDETIVLVQIEDRAGVSAMDAIAATDGIDGLFAGSADLTVSLGVSDIIRADTRSVTGRVGKTARKHGKAAAVFTQTTATAPDLRALGISVFFVASEHTFMLNAARLVAAEIAATE